MSLTPRYKYYRSIYRCQVLPLSLHWRHNGHNSVSNHQPHDCLFLRLFRRRSKETSKLRVTGLCVGNSPGTGEFPAQMASNAENVSIWWRHHVLFHAMPLYGDMKLIHWYHRYYRIEALLRAFKCNWCRCKLNSICGPYIAVLFITRPKFSISTDHYDIHKSIPFELHVTLYKLVNVLRCSDTDPFCYIIYPRRYVTHENK